MDRKNNKNRKKVVVIDGGTGSYAVLNGLKHFPISLSAIVTMADCSGSTGRFRDEHGVLPPGDIRQCLVALSESSLSLRNMFNYRYPTGVLKVHNVGNIFIRTLEKSEGSLEKALDIMGDLSIIHGEVIPVTLEQVRLVAELHNGKKLLSENEIPDYQLLSRCSKALISDIRRDID